jgi:hypothetical protein
VNAKVTDKVICAFHAPVTFSRCRKRWKPFDIAEASTIKEASKMEKVRKNLAPWPTRNCSEYLHVIESTEPLYLLGNLQPGKSEKER